VPNKPRKSGLYLYLYTFSLFRWIVHTLRKVDGEIPKAASLWNPQGAGRQEDLRIAGEDRLSKKRVEAGMN
jgi:hypothetical protein